MKAVAPWILVLSGLMVLQSTAVQVLEVYHVTPDLFLVSVLLMAMKRRCFVWFAFPVRRGRDGVDLFFHHEK